MGTKKIALACDHKGLQLKVLAAEILKKRHWEVIDCGTFSEVSCDYPDFILDAAEKLSRGECERAVGICYTGIGSSIAANKVAGVRASLVHTVKEAELTRGHNDSNMLILGSLTVSAEQLPEILETWLDTPFEGGRHEQRLNKIKRYEQKRG